MLAVQVANLADIQVFLVQPDRKLCIFEQECVGEYVPPLCDNEDVGPVIGVQLAARDVADSVVDGGVQGPYVERRCAVNAIVRVLNLQKPVRFANVARWDVSVEGAVIDLFDRNPRFLDTSHRAFAG